jgi:predicted nuclease of predicted toxin-antitoxin system
MRFLLVENFPKAACPLLFSLSHELFDFRDFGVEGSQDSEIVKVAASKCAVILTTDVPIFSTRSVNNFQIIRVLMWLP